MSEIKAQAFHKALITDQRSKGLATLIRHTPRNSFVTF